MTVAPIIMAARMPPVASRRRTGDCTDSCPAAATYGASDDRARRRATARRTLRECVRQGYGHSHTQQEQRKYNPTHWVTPLMLDPAALQCFFFEVSPHFIRVAIEAQEKPVATLTCLLDASSALISVVMRWLAACL
jgi:hypothetical protein